MKKAEIRKVYLQKMRQLAPFEHDHKSKLICKRFFNSVDFSVISVVHLFLPILKNNEVNTSLIIDRIGKEYSHIKIVIPKIDFNTLEMTSHILKEEMVLVQNSSGILEPHEEEHIDEKAIDLVVLPLLAYDCRGYRVGYGKGFYDRFLINCKKDVKKIGLSFFGPIAEVPDINEHDIPMDQCITPEKVITF